MKDNWNIKKLKDICDVRDGTHDSPKYYDVGIPFITSKNLMENKIDFENVNFIKVSDHKKISERSFVEKGDILFGMIGTVGKPVVVNVDFEFSIKNVALLKFSKSNNFINSYAIQVLKSSIISDQFKRKSDGGVQNFVSLNTIRSLEIPVPPLPQQKKIAKILSTCDEVIEKTEAAIAKYKAIKQGMMHDLFTRGIDTTTGKLRPSYQEAPELYKESALGMIPKEWEADGFKNYMTHLLNGGTPSTSILSYWQGNIPWISGADFSESFEITPIRRFISNEAVLNSSTNVIKKGEILLVTRTGVGKLAIAPFDISISQDITGLIVNRQIADVNFLFYYLQNLVNDFKKLNQGTSINGITRNDLLDRIVIFPPKSEQILISEKLKTLDTKLQAEESALQKYKKIKEGLMQDLLTGRVEVSE